jgi:hypothetical protein
MSEEVVAPESQEVDQPELEAAEESQQPAKEPAADKPANMSQEEWEEFELKVNGKTVKEKINLKDKGRIAKALQLEKAAQQAFQERAMTAKQLQEVQEDVQEFLQQFTADPLSIIMNPEFNLSQEQKRQLAEAILREDLERSQKTPEQIEAEEIKKKYESILKEKEELENRRREEEKSRMQEEASRELEQEIVDALDSGALPRSEYLSKKLADLAYIAYSNGVDISTKEIIPFLKTSYRSDMVEMIRGLADDEVEEIVSKERIRQIRNKQIQAVKPKEGTIKSPLKTEDTGSSSKTKEENQKMRSSDFFKQLRG